MTTKTCRGFSAVEIVVAIAILGVGIYAAAEMVDSSRRTASLTDFRIQANSIAQTRIQEFRAARNNIAPALATLSADAKGNKAWPPDGPVRDKDNPRYQWQAFFQPETTSGLVRVSVRVAEAVRPKGYRVVSARLFVPAPGTEQTTTSMELKGAQQ